MQNELNEQMRAEFEAWAKEHFICTPYSFARTANGLYYNTVASRDAPVVYAAVSMLWAAWRESRRQHGVAAQAVYQKGQITFAGVAWLDVTKDEFDRLGGNIKRVTYTALKGHSK